MDALEYFSGTAEIFLAKRLATGLPGPFRWVGDALMEFGFTPNETKFKENWTGQRGDGLVLPGDTEANLTITFLQFNNQNFSIVSRGEEVAQVVTPVTGRSIATALPEVGQRLSLQAYNVSEVIVKDSTVSTPKTLTLGTNYKLHAKSGDIEILDITTGGPFLAPLKADLTPGAVDFVRMMSGSAQEFWVKAVGKNTVPGATFKNFVAELYRWSPPPSETMSLIQDGQSRLESPVAGSVLADTTKAADDQWGYYGRLAMLA